MSRAFAPGESEDDEERLLIKRPVLPPGTPNYITPVGARKLEAERERLIAEKAALPSSVEAKQRGKALDAQVSFLTQRLNSAQVIDPARQPKDRVLFGAQVTVKDAQGKTHVWHIVGIDEADFNHGRFSWISPLATTLLDKRVGEKAVVGGQTYIIEEIV